LDELITQQVGQTLFLYMLIMQNLDEVLLHKYCEKRVFIVTYFLTYNKSRKKKEKKYKRIHMKKARKIAQVGGEGPK